MTGSVENLLASHRHPVVLMSQISDDFLQFSPPGLLRSQDIFIVYHQKPGEVLFTFILALMFI